MFADILIACRLCLCKDTKQSYFYIEKLEFTNIQQNLGLKENFAQLGIYPNHVCKKCKDMLKKYEEFKTTSLQNELFIVQCQDNIKHFGLDEALLLFDKYENVSVLESKEEMLSVLHETFVFDNDREHGDGENDNVKEYTDKLENKKEINNHTKNILHTVAIHDQDDQRMDIQLEDVDNTFKVRGNKNQRGIKYLIHYNEPGVCILCHKQYISLKEHEEKFHDHVESIKCPQCKKTVWKTKTRKAKAQVKAHINAVHGTGHKEQTPCKICGKVILKYSINVHLKTTHSAPRYPCTNKDCKKILKTKESLSRHINNKHLNIKTICTACGEAVKNAEGHKRKCSPSQEQLTGRTCNICEKVLASKIMLTYHMNAKHGQGTAKLPCPVCGEYMVNLDNHIKLKHTEEGKQRPFKCTVEGCAAAFKVKANAQIHLSRVHGNLKVPCDICGQWLKNIEDHMRTVHQTGPKHPCPEVC